MPKFKFSSPNLTDNMTHFLKQYATESKYSVIGLIDSTSGEFTLAPCDTPLNVNAEIRSHQGASHPLKSQRDRGKSGSGRQLPIIYNAVSSVTSDEVYSEVRDRSMPGKPSANSWIIFAIHYDAAHSNKLVFSALPYDSTKVPEDNFLQGFIGTKFEAQFLMLHTAMVDAVHWVELDKLIKYDDVTLQQMLKQYNKNELADFCRILESTRAVEKYSENPNHFLLICMLKSRIRINEAMLKTSSFPSHVSQKQIKKEVPFRPIVIAQACLESCQTLDVFKAPVVAVDGQLYERQDIELWFKRNSDNPTSPLTNELLKNKDTTLIPFRLLATILTRGKYEIFVEDLICPLTNKFMKEPVLAFNGVLYEREAIQKEFDINPTSEKIKDIKTRELISMPWVNSRRDELIKQNPHVLNPIKPAAEIVMKSTHSAVLASFIEEKKPHSQVSSEQELKTSKQIYNELMSGVSFSRLELHEKTRLINAIIRRRDDAEQQRIFSDLVENHIHILVELFDVYKDSFEIFEYAEEDSDRFEKNIKHVRNRQLESINAKHFEMSRLSFTLLHSDVKKIKYVYQLCTFEPEELDQILSSQARLSTENIRALHDFLPTVVKRYNLAPYVDLAVTTCIEKHMKMYSQDDLQRHRREKEQKDEDNKKMQKQNDQSLQPRMKSTRSLMYAPSVPAIQKPEDAVPPVAVLDKEESSKLNAFQRS